MSYEGIIFDLNGVILWDTPWHKEAWSNFSQELRGKPFSDEEWLGLIGKSNRDILEYILRRALPLEEVTILARRKEEAYRSVARLNPSQLHVSPGAEELFRWLVAQGIAHTIATSSEITNLLFFLETLKLETWFDRTKIIYDDGIIPCKPNPDLYLRAAAAIKIAPSACIVVEDAYSGIMAAKNAGIGKIIALGPRESHDRLRSIAGVGQVIETLAEIDHADFRFGEDFFAGAFLWNPKTQSVLLHHRDGNTAVNPNMWGFFGGLNEGSETPEQTIIRELKEELDIDVKPDQLIALCDYPNEQSNRHRYVFYVESELEKSQMTLGEGQGFDWIPLSRVFEYDLTEKSRHDLETFSRL